VRILSLADHQDQSGTTQKKIQSIVLKQAATYAHIKAARRVVSRDVMEPTHLDPCDSDIENQTFDIEGLTFDIESEDFDIVCTFGTAPHKSDLSFLVYRLDTVDNQVDTLQHDF
jgi:hypothetical protein